MKYEKLFSPITINSLTLKNRIVQSPSHMIYTTYEGYVTDRFKSYYWKRAENEIGLIMTGGCRFDDSGCVYGMMSLSDDSFIPGYREFTDGCHQRGAKVGVQLFHAGAYTKKENCLNGAYPMAPSAVRSGFTREIPREMTLQDMEQLIEKWAAAALRAREAGFDLVEILCSAGYLLCQFLSPLTNQRTDQYGGSFENRCRFPLEVIAALRKALGPDYPLTLRLAANDLVPGGNNLEDAVRFAKLTEHAGIDAIHVTAGWHESKVPQITGDVPRGSFAYLSQAIKDAVSIPVIAANRINDPAIAEKLIALESCDMVGLCRALVADPRWASKAKAGEESLIRRCVGCNQGCLANIFQNKPVQCLVNGTAGRESAFTASRRSVKKKLLVIGGGPAGCTFAIAAAQLGHQVALWEKTDSLGGQLTAAAAPPGKHEFSFLPAYYAAALKQAGVEVLLGQSVEKEAISSTNADSIIVACGSHPKALNLEGLDPQALVSAQDILLGRRMAGRRVLIVGGGSVGCETAQFLAREGSISPDQFYYYSAQKVESPEKIASMANSTRRNISIIEALPRIGGGYAPGTGWPVLADLKRLGVRSYTEAKIQSISDNRIRLEYTVRDRRLDQTETYLADLEFDTIVSAIGSDPCTQVFQQLQQAFPTKDIRSLGDCQQIGTVLSAVQSACDLVLKV